MSDLTPKELAEEIAWARELLKSRSWRTRAEAEHAQVIVALADEVERLQAKLDAAYWEDRY